MPEIQFMQLPVTFEVHKPFKRWKNSGASVIDFDNPQLNATLSTWEVENFEPKVRITIAMQTRSLLGIRWKTADGKRFTTGELNDLLRAEVIVRV